MNHNNSILSDPIFKFSCVWAVSQDKEKYSFFFEAYEKGKLIIHYTPLIFMYVEIEVRVYYCKKREKYGCLLSNNI